jgi:ADP-ribose pyrophosphatase YjhB (NUDIX family)
MRWLKPLLLRLWKALPLPAAGRRALVWLGSPKFVVGVQAVAFDEAGRVLLLRHTYRPRDPWGLPGGLIRPREQPAAALARELAEETGLDMEVGAVFHVAAARRLPWLTAYFLCRPRGGTFEPDTEVSTMRWCPLDALPRGGAGPAAGPGRRARPAPPTPCVGRPVRQAWGRASGTGAQPAPSSCAAVSN